MPLAENQPKFNLILSLVIYLIIYIYLAPELGEGLGRILSCGARKPEQT